MRLIVRINNDKEIRVIINSELVQIRDAQKESQGHVKFIYKLL